MNGNFLHMFCPELQKIIKTMIYNLTRKGRQFIWGEEQQSAFEEIKYRLIRPPILHMPKCEGRFHLYSEMQYICYGKHFISNTEWKTKINSLCKLKDFLKQLGTIQ